MASLKDPDKGKNGGPKQTDPDDWDKVSPSQDHTNRFRDDQLLRKYGFRIHSRPKYGAPLWVRNGCYFYQSEAMKEVATSEFAPEDKAGKRGVS